MFEDPKYPDDYICAPKPTIRQLHETNELCCMKCKAHIPKDSDVFLLNVSSMIHPVRREKTFEGACVFFAQCKNCA